MQVSHQRILRLPWKLSAPRAKRYRVSLRKNLRALQSNTRSVLQYIKSLGYTNTLDEYELGKLGVFNQVNFVQLLVGILIFSTCLFHKQFPGWACMVASL